MASNMDYVGTFEMGLSLQKFHMTNAVSKFYSLDAWINSINKGLDLNYNFMTFGLEKVTNVYETISSISQKTNNPMVTGVGAVMGAVGLVGVEH